MNPIKAVESGTSMRIMLLSYGPCTFFENILFTSYSVKRQFLLSSDLFHIESSYNIHNQFWGYKLEFTSSNLLASVIGYNSKFRQTNWESRRIIYRP